MNLVLTNKTGGSIMKGRRQKKILEMIAHEPISTQSELVLALQNNGFNVTQATVSRDIKELRLVKIARSDNQYVYGLPKGHVPIQDENRLRRLFRDAVMHLDHSENIVVIHTLPGNANSVCSLLDAVAWPEILGAVAGDDTIIVVIRSKEAVPLIMSRLNAILE
jgi:transcriptional regulator of arginine metabolism